MKRTRGHSSLSLPGRAFRPGPTRSPASTWSTSSQTSSPGPGAHLEALAAFFGVPAAYFFDDDTAARVDSQLALATALRDAGVRNAALRISTLDDASRQSILRIVQEVTQMYSSASDRGTATVGPEQPPE